MHVLKYVEPIQSFIPNFQEVESNVRKLSIDDVLSKIGGKRSVYVKGNDLEKIKKLINLPSKVTVLECFKLSSNYLPISIVTYFEDCPWKFITMVKLGEVVKNVLNLSNDVYLVKLLSDSSVRRMYLGKLIHEEYLITLEAYLSEYRFVSEVEVEKDIVVKVRGNRLRLFTIIGRCDGILVDDDVYVLELKLRYMKYHVFQHSLYGLCIGSTKLLAVDKNRKSIVKSMDKKEIAKKLYIIYKILNNKQIEEITVSGRKCRKCMYRNLCLFLNKKIQKLIE